MILIKYLKGMLTGNMENKGVLEMVTIYYKFFQVVEVFGEHVIFRFR